MPKITTKGVKSTTEKKTKAKKNTKQKPALGSNKKDSSNDPQPTTFQQMSYNKEDFISRKKWRLQIHMKTNDQAIETKSVSLEPTSVFFTDQKMNQQQRQQHKSQQTPMEHGIVQFLTNTTTDHAQKTTLHTFFKSLTTLYLLWDLHMFSKILSECVSQNKQNATTTDVKCSLSLFLNDQNMFALKDVPIIYNQSLQCFRSNATFTFLVNNQWRPPTTHQVRQQQEHVANHDTNHFLLTFFINWQEFLMILDQMSTIKTIK